jgi:hypothetical protein
MSERPLRLPVVALSEDVGARRPSDGPDRRLAFFVPRAANPPPDKEPTPRAA